LRRETEKTETFLRHLRPLEGGLEGYCRRLLHDQNDVPDVPQSPIANAYRDFHLYAERTNFRAWVFRNVHLEIQNCNRNYQRHRRESLPEELSAEDAWDLALAEPLFKALLEDPDRILNGCDDVVSHALKQFSFLERSVLLLQAVGGFKYREIDEILQIPIGTVMSSLARSRLRLSQRLVEYGLERRLLAPEET